MKNFKHVYAFLIFATVLTALASAFSLYRAGHWRFNHPTPDVFPVQGLDVSHHQGAIDWQAVPKDRFRFVYIKASEGGDFRDTRFQENWTAARANGFKVGAYHFFTLCKPGAEQAANFTESAPPADDALPPVIDLEYVGNCKNRPHKETFTEDLADFIEEAEEHFGRQPVLYTTYEFYKDYLQGSEFQDYPFWIRDVFAQPDKTTIPNWAIWQYADNVRVPGIETPVDANVMQPDFWDQQQDGGTI